ncbi:MAG: Si-specific NAD(P)(+) transhydrogenase [Planctomycetota bacterium]|nr:Si-specific NAD(P)(+) transhydrogenase [Planctomycetota bacterium]MCX8039338.1 Si-specific NAD(P)(+) transhydrogenase [Planctomycetota bacterium]MDW8373629.1 Si-specific NAD(P)(+) transhydrogenase [Planctomycetota bacterium]
MSDYDVLVIGSGPGGEGAAMQAAKSGLRVAVIERHHEVGGGCTHWGTIPSKALRQAIFQWAAQRSSPLARALGASPVSIPQLRAAATQVIRKQVAMRADFYERNQVAVHYGQARFLDPHTLEVIDRHGGRELHRAETIVIATGSRPHHPPEVDFTHPRIRDSDTILDLPETPRSLTIYGAGVVGCEYASMFRNLGVKVNLVNTRDRLLSYLDDEIVDALAYHLRDQGCLVRHNESAERVEPRDDGVVLHLASGKQLFTDYLLWANGRTGNTEDLGLERIGLQPHARGWLSVDERFRTAVPSVLAVGDVIGPPALASAAYDQGRAAICALLALPDYDQRLGREVPTGIYTSPEISSVGKTERELTAAKVPYEVGHALFRSLARAQIVGQTVGMLKILFHRQTLEILGIHCFGYQATEIIHIGQAVMTQPPPHNTVRWFVNHTFNYPTMAEAYRVAALNGLNRLF